MEARLTNSSDQELLSCFHCEQDEAVARQAAAELLGRYRQRIYRWCRRYVKEHEQALDLAQDVLLTAYEHLNGLPDGTCFGAWLYTVTRNRCLVEIRRLTVRMTEPVDPETLPATAKNPEEKFLEGIAEDRFLALIGRELDSQEQEAISLRCFDKLPVDSVTEILGLTAATGARSVLQRARRKLRAAMELEDRDRRRDEGWRQ